MTSILPTHAHNLSIKARKNPWGSKSNTSFCGCSILVHTSAATLFAEGQYSLSFCEKPSKAKRHLTRAVKDDAQSGPAEENDKDINSPMNEKSNSGLSRDDLEKLIGTDDSSFSGIDLATLIRRKYGRSYDVQLIKKEFMGKNLLAMNVMWKYREQRSFPLSEEEYILRLDDVANTLKCWGAVSHIRNSLAKLKERPRIGKAVSIFIDMDETGGRSNEWIYK